MVEKELAISIINKIDEFEKVFREEMQTKRVFEDRVATALTAVDKLQTLSQQLNERQHQFELQMAKDVCMNTDRDKIYRRIDTLEETAKQNAAFIKLVTKLLWFVVPGVMIVLATGFLSIIGANIR